MGTEVCKISSDCWYSSGSLSSISVETQIIFSKGTNLPLIVGTKSLPFEVVLCLI